MNINPVDLSPEAFELTVKSWLDATGKSLTAFESSHRNKLSGSDGKYEIDVTAKFEELGVQFLVLVECKHQRSPVKRDVVQVLYDRLRATGAHKGIMFATTTFQRGAIEYAQAHGIALVQIADGQSSYVTKSFSPQVKPPSWLNLPDHIGWLTSLTDKGHRRRCIVSTKDPEYLNRYLFS